MPAHHGGHGSASEAAPGDADLPVVALVGRPNVGKSTFLARASGKFVETANAPGTTVVIERRRIEIDGQAAWLVDLPGTRSLADRPASTDPFWTLFEEVRPDAILVIVDAGDLPRHLPLVLACRDLGLPIVVAANLSDEAEGHGIDVDAGRLSQVLLAPVHLTNGRSGHGVRAAARDAIRLAQQRRAVRLGERLPRATQHAPTYPPAVERELQAEAQHLLGLRSVGAAAIDPSGIGRLIAISHDVSAQGSASPGNPENVDRQFLKGEHVDVIDRFYFDGDRFSGNHLSRDRRRLTERQIFDFASVDMLLHRLAAERFD